MKDKFKNSLNKYELDEDSLSNIKSNIYTKYKKHQRNKKILLSVVTCFFIVISSLSIAYADEIKATVDKIFINVGKKQIDEEGYLNSFIIETNALKELNYKSTIEGNKCTLHKIHYKYGELGKEQCYPIYKVNKIEKLLDIKILSNYKENEMYLYRLEKDENNNISFVYIRDKNTLDKEYKNDKIFVSTSIIMKTKYYKAKNEEHNINEMFKLGISKNAKEENYYIKSLKTNAVIVEKNEHEMKEEQGRRVGFVYDNIVYTYYFVPLSDEENFDKNIKEYLESLSY